MAAKLRPLLRLVLVAGFIAFGAGCGKSAASLEANNANLFANADARTKALDSAANVWPG